MTIAWPKPACKLKRAEQNRGRKQKHMKSAMKAMEYNINNERAVQLLTARLIY